MKEARFPEQKAHFEKLRKEGITQAELIRACKEKAGVCFSTRTVSRWYNGACQISKSNAERVIAALGLDCSAAWLRGESEYINPQVEAAAFMDALKNQDDVFTMVFHALSTLSSYSLMSVTSYVPGEERFGADETAARLDHALLVTADGQEKRLSSEAVKRIRLEASDYIDYLIAKAIEREERR